ncbi:Fimbrillin-like [Prevotellaceae bacterium MN60]|nr:Fimbrillin-like [Prevotellaceae bacterium MN60]
MIKSIYNHSPRGGGAAFLGFLLTTAISCADGLDPEASGLLADNDEQEAVIQIGEDVTRGAYVAGPSLTRYAIYGFYNDKKTLYLNNSILTRDKPGDAWKKSKAVQYPSATRAVDFYAMAPGFSGGLVTSSKMQQTEKYIKLTMPTVNSLQTDYMFSSIMAQTRKATNNIVKFNFKHIFCYLRFTSKLSNADIDVTIHSVKLHNLKSTGTFTMDNNKANTGSWTLDDAYADYEFILPKDSLLTYKKTVTLHHTDSLLFVMPQNPTLFKFAEGKSFEEADANKQAYASVKCRITKKDDGSYIGCTSTTWAEVYYPINSASWVTKSQPFGTTKAVSIEFTGGYTKEGNDFLKEYSGDSNLENTSIEGVQGGIYSTEDWVDDTDNSVTITL